MSGGAAHFSQGYAEARARFRAAAEALGASLEAHDLGLSGPNDEALTIDFARIGPADAARVMLVTSGLHGVEGYFGSAVQLAELDRLAKGARLAADQALVLVHALNPYGFAFGRRANEDNLDLNRSFFRPGAARPDPNTRVVGLDEFLNPQAPAGHGGAFLPRAIYLILRYGYGRVKNAIAGGQYSNPRGLFYGGRRDSRTQEIVAANLARWIGPARRIVHVDFHTGLGKSGTHKLLYADHGDPVRRSRLAAAFGEANLEAMDAGGVSYAVTGHFPDWCEAELAGIDYLGIAAEFGTYPGLKVLAAMRAENQGHFWSMPGDPQAAAASARFVEMFCPADPVWRDKVVADGLGIVAAGLSV
ncbi:MAG TPA: DUF2817 domain-containing protein [Kaistiaceae bacterium]|nr:DUF2817 domain-containing protein [Kaistiaceae bacterium]